MPDFLDQAKKLASEHSDLVDKGLDQASDLAKEKTGGKYDEHIETAERFGRSVHHVVDRRGIAHVALHPRHPVTVGRRRPVIRRDDGGARLAQHLDCGSADARRTAGDEDAPTAQR